MPEIRSMAGRFLVLALIVVGLGGCAQGLKLDRAAARSGYRSTRQCQLDRRALRSRAGLAHGRCPRCGRGFPEILRAHSRRPADAPFE